MSEASGANRPRAKKTKKLSTATVKQPLDIDLPGPDEDGPSDPSGRAVQSGLVMMVDIVEFSGRPADEQVKLVQKLGRVISNSPLIHDKSTYGTILRSGGDGCLLAMRESVAESELIRLALVAIDAMASGDQDCPSAGLRVGLHRGPFTETEDWASGGMDAIGTAPNLCERVLGFADPGYIVASDAFCSHWENQENGVTPQFSRAIRVYAKHDFSLRIRIYRGEGSLHKDRLPAKVEELFRTELEIIRTLGNVESAFVSRLEEKYNGRPPRPDRLSARVSLFGFRNDGTTVPGKPKGILEPTIYRFHRAGIRPARGHTHYPVDDPPATPQARAFVNGRAKALVGLTDPSKDLASYVEQLGENGFSKEMIKAFSRNARSFLCFHFGRDDLGDLGIVCIDCHHPLSKISATDMETIGSMIQENYSALLASLWHGRLK